MKDLCLIGVSKLELYLIYKRDVNTQFRTLKKKQKIITKTQKFRLNKSLKKKSNQRLNKRRKLQERESKKMKKVVNLLMIMMKK